VAEQPGLDVLRSQWFAEQRVVEQVDLTDRQVIRSPPIGIDPAEVLRRQGLPGNDLDISRIHDR
jgi:hypothetical protein